MTFLKSVAVASIVIAFATPHVRAETERYVSAAAGALTTGSWHEALVPGQIDFADSYMIAGAVGWDRSLGNSRFRLGVELQLTGHAGVQDHLELSLPVTLRYDLGEGRRVRSLAGGLGLSYASDVPEVEIIRNGASQRLFVHWMAEVEFASKRPERSTFLRLHHRSDGYGVFEVDAGSTGWLFGVRHRY
ncbi:MAG: hypothetical protein AAGM84_09445 [Pseudomonadota bacterium]